MSTAARKERFRNGVPFLIPRESGAVTCTNIAKSGSAITMRKRVHVFKNALAWQWTRATAKPRAWHPWRVRRRKRYLRTASAILITTRTASRTVQASCSAGLPQSGGRTALRRRHHAPGRRPRDPSRTLSRPATREQWHRGQRHERDGTGTLCPPGFVSEQTCQETAEVSRE